MPNPSGSNQFLDSEVSPKYGDVKRLQELTKKAPMSGAPISALNAPKRSQKKAVAGVRPKAPRQAASAVQPSQIPIPVPTPPLVDERKKTLISFYESIVGKEGADPLWLEYLDEARVG